MHMQIKLKTNTDKLSDLKTDISILRDTNVRLCFELDVLKVISGIQQGSTLGLLLFSLYIIAISNTIKNYNVS